MSGVLSELSLDGKCSAWRVFEVVAVQDTTLQTKVVEAKSNHAESKHGHNAVVAKSSKQL